MAMAGPAISDQHHPNVIDPPTFADIKLDFEDVFPLYTECSLPSRDTWL